jgi:E3 ubiquitin-protein ligase synoviolin
VDADRLGLALEILYGLPEQFRQDILDGWPDREMAHVLSAGGETLPPPASGRFNLAAYHVSVLAMQFSFESRILLLLGIPKTPFRDCLVRYFQDPQINSELEKLDIAISDLDRPLPNVSSLLESISDWTEIPSLSGSSDKDATEKAEKETRDIANKRIQVLNDISRAMRTAANRLEQAHRPSSAHIVGRFNPNNELSLFGQRSIFDSSAQSHVLDSFEKDIIAEEQLWLEKQHAVEGLLSTIGESSNVGLEKGKGRATVEDGEE